MAKFDDITIDVKAKLDVDRKTAEGCLKLVELYCNAHGKTIIGHKSDGGDMELEFEDSPSASANAMTREDVKQMVEAIKDGFAKKNIREGCYG